MIYKSLTSFVSIAVAKIRTKFKIFHFFGGHTCVSSDRSIRAKFICGRKPWILLKIKMWRAALSVEPVKGRFLCTRTDSWVLTHAEGPACASTHVCKHTRASSPWGRLLFLAPPLGFATTCRMRCGVWNEADAVALEDRPRVTEMQG